MVNVAGPPVVDYARAAHYLIEGSVPPVRRHLLGFEMPAIESTAPVPRPLLLAAAFGGAMLAATLGLWAFYGTTVFFEMVRTGWIACF